MFQFIIPIILASTFIDENGWSCDPQNSIKIINTPQGIEVQEKRLFGYYTSEKKIYICPQVMEDKKLYTLVYIHEYAHHIFFTKMTQVQRDEWASLTNDHDSYVSDYAKRHYEEDFAETFAYIILKKELNIKNNFLMKKKEFISKHISLFNYK